ncbi:MAG: hypothetical protein IKF53_01820 [Clostridia bacterium]|nr:hypothetical protein [Clostridia bacterium]
MKKLLHIVMVLLFLVGLFNVSGCKTGNLKIVDTNGEEIITVNSITDERNELEKCEQKAYVDEVLRESEQIICDLNNCKLNEARAILLKNDYTIHTSFDKDIYNSVKNGYMKHKIDGLSLGCAVTDLDGNILALFSTENRDKQFVNYATENTPPYSSFKPLGVYAPAIETNIASWSTVYPDIPLKKIKNNKGEDIDWPSNANGVYSNQNVIVADAIKTSLNTVAVHCMKRLGVDKSFSFLEERFGLILKNEKQKAQTYGEEEIIGNVALGYFDAVSPKDMAGFYQVFANGGKYIKPHTVTVIEEKNNKKIYSCKPFEKQVIKESTAFVMNKLLQNVVSPGGTGEKARCEGVPVGGKTGTGDDGNWFVGFTPDYTCAVWHGVETKRNNACEFFSEIVNGFSNKTRDYPDCKDVEKAAYCCESGMLINQKCKKTGLGYYTKDNIPNKCIFH